MTDAAWSPGDLSLLGAAREQEIAVRREGGRAGSRTPIWVVAAGGQVFVRSWHRRDTGWFGLAVRTGAAAVGCRACSPT